MGMNILSLNAKEVTLIKTDTSSVSYRINADKIKADIKNAKENGEIRDLLQISNVDQQKISSIDSSGEIKRTTNNYSVDAFFRKDMPKITNADGSYSVGNVTFTEQELVKARNVMMTASKEVNGGAGIKSSLDYKDYASMALAETAVNQYAKENFNEKQQAVIAKAMKSYNEGLEDLQNDMIHNGSFAQNDYGEISQYYGLSLVIDQNQADAMNGLKEEIGRVTGQTNFKKSEAGELAGVSNIATNKTLINQMKTLFDNVDVSNQDAFTMTMNRYQELIKPAYAASGFGRNTDMIIRHDKQVFAEMFEKIKISQAYKSVDYSV